MTSIRGLGIDLVEIERIRGALGRHGERFAERILAESELAEYRACADRVRFLARRFAAKEAVVKALGTGFRDGIGLRDIAVVHDPAGRPALACSGGAAAELARQGRPVLHITLTDERHYALACVVAEAG